MNYYATLIEQTKSEYLNSLGNGYYAEILRQKYNAEEGEWITVKGSHILVKPGQKKEDAVKQFLKEKETGHKESPQKKKEESKYVDNPNFVKETKKMLKDIREHKGLDNVQEITFREVNEEEAKKIERDIGLNLKGYKHNLSNTDIKHIFDRHGKEKEKLRGQEPITDEDILKIPEITQNYDKISVDEKKAEDRKVIKYEKKIGDTYYYFESVGGKRNKTLKPKTFYKIKGRHTE